MMIERRHELAVSRGRARLRRGALLVSAGTLILGAALIHLASTQARFAESPYLGAGSAALGLAQLVLGAGMIIAPARRLVLVGALASAGAAALWAVGHTLGLPVGLTLWRPGPLSISDLFLPVLEGGAVPILVLAAARAPLSKRGRAWWRALVLVPVVLLVSMLTAAGAIGAPGDTWLPVGTAVTPAPDRTTTVAYCSPNGSPLAMDVTEPAATATRPAPAVLYVHGGGFLGDRRPSGLGASLAGQDGALFLPLRDGLTRRGFVVAAIDYRQAPLQPWPDAIEDVKCAVRFMRSEAARLGIDPNRIGAWGSSSGGTLVSLLATAGPAEGLDVGEYPEQSSRVQAVVDMFGATDLNQMRDSTAFGRFMVQVTYGGGDTTELAAASPINHVTGGDPPFLILQGTDDAIVRPHHSIDMAQRLDAIGTRVTLVMVERAAHSLNTPGQRPSPEDVTVMVSDFFGRTLTGP